MITAKPKSASPYTRVVAGVLFPLHELMKRHSTVAVRRAMEKSQWWPAARLRDLQMKRLRALLTRAQTKVPYYRDLFQAIGFDPARQQ